MEEEEEERKRGLTLGMTLKAIAIASAAAGYRTGKYNKNEIRLGERGPPRDFFWDI